MTGLSSSTGRRVSIRAKRFIGAAVAGAMAGAVSSVADGQAPPAPSIEICNVYQGQAGWAMQYYDDYDFKPYFYVQWDTSPYSGNNNFSQAVIMYFWFGNNCTDTGNSVNVWQVYNDPYYDHTLSFLLTQTLDSNNESFYPWHQPTLDSGDNLVWPDLPDFDEDMTYEIGVQADAGGEFSSVTWAGATFST